MRTLPPSITLPAFVGGRRVVEWRRWAPLDDAHDVAVPIVQVGVGRAVQFVADLGSAIKVPRVTTTATPSPQRSSGIGTLLGIGIAIVGGIAIYQSWKRGQHSADVIHGYASEDVIADDLEHAWGGAVDVSPGSRGAADLDARLPIGRFAIQAKSSRRGEARWRRPAEIARLRQLARRRGARAVVALRSRTGTTFHDSRTREPIDL